MRNKFTLVFEVAVALVALVVGYTLVTGVSPGFNEVAARPAIAPVNPNILYLAPESTQRGVINDAVMKSNGASLGRDWQSARSVSENHPLDALLIDADLFEIMSEADQAWLNTQFQDGVIIVGLGISNKQLLQHLGLEVSRIFEKRDLLTDSTGYLIMQGIVLGQPDDLEIVEASHWIAKEISGESEPLSGIQYPLVTSFGKAQGELNSPEDLRLLFRYLMSQIEYTYETRAEYKQSLKAFEEK